MQNITHSETHSRVWLDLPKAIDSMGDEAAARDMLSMLSPILNDMVQQAETALTQGDLTTVRGILHQVNGSLGLFAVTPLAQAASRLELDAMETNLSKVQAEFDPLKSQLRGFCGEVDAYLSSPSA